MEFPELCVTCVKQDVQALCLAGFPVLDGIPLQTLGVQRAEQGLGLQHL